MVVCFPDGWRLAGGRKRCFPRRRKTNCGAAKNITALGTWEQRYFPIPWKLEHKGKALNGLGEQTLLASPLTAFFASRQCPGSAIRAAMEWALQRARGRRAVISGFHSPLEQSVLHLLLEARSPVVAVLARPVGGARLKPEWKLALAEQIVVAYASTNGGLIRHSESWTNQGLPVSLLC